MDTDKPSSPLQEYKTKFQTWYRDLPEKKRYLEFITALLSIPVLITIIISNVNNINQKAQQQEASPSASPAVIIREIQSTNTATPSPIESPNPSVSVSSAPTNTQSQCIPQVGSVEIVSPEQNETVSKNPVCIDIVRSSAQYCSVVWSYRINSSSWSDYTDKSICIYEMQPGVKSLELRVKSVVSGDETLLKRTFTVTVNPTPNAATESGSL